MSAAVKKRKLRSKPTPFQLAKDRAAADLMSVAMLFETAAERVNEGDLDAVNALCEKLPLWQQMLLIRHDERMRELREADAPKPSPTPAGEPRE